MIKYLVLITLCALIVEAMSPETIQTVSYPRKCSNYKYKNFSIGIGQSKIFKVPVSRLSVESGCRSDSSLMCSSVASMGSGDTGLSTSGQGRCQTGFPLFVISSEAEAIEYEKLLSIAIGYDAAFQYTSLPNYVSSDKVKTHITAACKDNDVMAYFSQFMNHTSANESIYWFFSDTHVAQAQDYNVGTIAYFSDYNCREEGCVSDFSDCLIKLAE